MMEDNDVAQDMLETLHVMQKRGELCDIFLYAGDDKQPTHRCILASRSRLLRKRFVEKFDKSGIDSFEVEGISKGCLSHFVDFVYTGSFGKSELLLGVVDEILTTAQGLEVTFDRQKVLDYFRRFMRYSQFKHVLELAEKIDFNELKEFAFRFVTENLAEFMIEGHEAFCNLQIDQLTDMLSRQEMKEVSSRVKVRAVIKWCINEFHDRAECLDILLRYVTLNQTVKTTLLSEIQRLKDTDALPSAYLDLVDGVFHNKGNLNDSFFNSESVIFIAGGEGEGECPSDKLILFDPEVNSIVHQTQLPSQCLDHSAAVVNGMLFIAGGQRSNNSKSKDSTDHFYSYNPATNDWTVLPPMQKCRSVFSLIALDGKIYAIAGKNSLGSLASAERYDPANSSWSYISHTYTGLFGHAGTISDDMIFVSGGIVAGRHFTHSLQCYKPKIDKWIHMAPMTQKRAFHSMCAVGNKLYVIGGNTCNESGLRVDCDFMEQYCLESDRWTYLISMPRPVSLAGSTAFDGKIFIIGGYSGKGGKKYSEIQRYHVKRKQWSIVGNLPSSVMRLTACSSKL